MNRKLALALPLLAAAACTTPITVLSSSSSSGSGSGGAGVSSSSSAGGGEAGGSSISFVSSSSSSAGSGGGSSICAGIVTFIDVEGDGPTQHFTSVCHYAPVYGNPTGPVAHAPLHGGFVEGLVISGCASSDPASAGVDFTISVPSVPGTDTKATLQYTDASLLVWQSAGAPVTVTLTLDEGVGGVVEGSYTATVGNLQGTRTLSGSFRVCHADEFKVP